MGCKGRTGWDRAEEHREKSRDDTTAGAAGQLGRDHSTCPISRVKLGCRKRIASASCSSASRRMNESSAGKRGRCASGPTGRLVDMLIVVKGKVAELRGWDRHDREWRVRRTRNTRIMSRTEPSDVDQRASGGVAICGQARLATKMHSSDSEGDQSLLCSVYIPHSYVLRAGGRLHACPQCPASKTPPRWPDL